MAANIIGSTFSTLIDEHYNRRMLETKEIKNDALKHAKKLEIPKGSSDVTHVNRIELYGLAQSVTDGTDLSSGTTPTVTEFKFQLKLRGDFISFSPYGDEIRIASILDDAYDQFQLQMARTANYDLNDMLANGDTSGSNTIRRFHNMFAGSATGFADLDNSGAYTLKQNDIRRAVGYLRKQGARGAIYALLNPYSYEDLFLDSSFQTLVSNAGNLDILKKDELPLWAMAKIGYQYDFWREALASAGGASGTYSASGAVVNTLVFAEDSFAAVQLMGRGGMKPKFKYQDITKVGVEATLGYFYPFKGGNISPAVSSIGTWGVNLRSVASDPSVSSVTAPS